jgi:hypothetical protein
MKHAKPSLQSSLKAWARPGQAGAWPRSRRESTFWGLFGLSLGLSLLATALAVLLQRRLAPCANQPHCGGKPKP